MKNTFHKHHITFTKYPFPIATVAKTPDLPVSGIDEIRTELRWPPEILTKYGEVLFVPEAERIHLQLFARINNIPDRNRSDVWANLLEPYLDTEPSDRIEQGILISLKNDGFSVDEIHQIRERVEKKMLRYNSQVWEWVHLGHYDLLMALGRFNQEIYDWACTIAARGRVFEPHAKDLLSEVDTRLGSLAFDLFGYTKQYSERAEKLKNLIISHHTEPHRFYHDLNHILKVLDLCESADATDSEKLALRVAAWFHDIVYNPVASDNEQQSADLMEETLSEMSVDHNIITTARQLIMITKHHLSASTDLEKIMVDADMFIFSQDPDTYDKYVSDVRKEYSVYEDTAFYQGRMIFLKSLKAHILQNGKLFHNLHPMNEQLAIENINREISAIQINS